MWRHARAIVAGAVVVLLTGCGSARASTPPEIARSVIPVVAIVPQPRDVSAGADAYTWPSRVRIGLSHRNARAGADALRSYLAENGVTAIVAGAGDPRSNIRLEVPAVLDARLGDEGYRLSVDRTGMLVEANTARGFFYAVQTLAQISVRSRGRLTSRAVAIVDRPEYRWRGIHLDVARHFFPVPVIERYVDVAARYKLNVFHWHLTDDQAWRLESARYPALTGGREHYSREDVRRVVAYAARRYVTVVPEIDLPGHAAVVLRTYPRLECAHETLCMNGAGLAFARDVLTEAMAEFPSPYVHVGGDEVPGPALAEQPRFTRDVERFVESRGRRFTGWDDVLTPQLSTRALVTVWTSPRRAEAAAARGNDVVLATGALHFDSVQGDPAQEPRGAAHVATLEQVYDTGVMPRGLRRTATAHVLGAQANVWTEHIATPDHLFFMTLPRELALAEDVWTPRSRKSWPSFLARLPAQLAWLGAHGYNFRIPNAAFGLAGGQTVFESVPGHVQSVRAWTVARALTVSLSVPLDGAVVRYTTDGSTPRASSRAYRGAFTVAAGGTPVVLRAAAFLRGRAGAVTECAVARVSPAALRAHRNASATWSALVSP